MLTHNSGQIKLYRADQGTVQEKDYILFLNTSNVEKHSRRILQLRLRFIMPSQIYVKRILIWGGKCNEFMPSIVKACYTGSK